MNNNKKVFIMIISLALVVITGTFAWLSWRSQNTAMVLTIGDIRGLTVTLHPYQINQSLSPVSDYTDGLVIDVTSSNARNEPDDFKLFYKIDTIDSALIDSGFKYTITKCSANCDDATNYTLLNNAGGDFASATSNSNLFIYEESIPANTTYKYKVYLWIDSSAGNQSSMQNKSFVGELRASVSSSPYGIMQDNAVTDAMSSKYVTNANGIQFGNISSDTNGKGIYLRAGTENDAFPIYYYRGAVTDNNVLFAGFCWKIVRTTSTGGTKLIYNGIPTGTNNNQCENTTGTATQLASVSRFAAGSDSLAYVGYMYGAKYAIATKAMTKITDVYMYGTGYDETNHKLITDGAMSFAGTEWATYYNQLSNNHYTCFNSTGECDDVKFIYSTSNTTLRGLTIPSGKTITGMIDEMLTSSTNSYSPTIKLAIDSWYLTNIKSYADKIEDTQYCNDRRMSQFDGWTPTGATNGSSYFISQQRVNNTHIPVLTCNTNDAFTVSASNGNGKLTHPVALLTSDEVMLAGGVSDNSNYYLYTNQTWWTMSPYAFYSTRAGVYAVINTGKLNSPYVSDYGGVRPVISLKYGTKFSGGTGIATDPYVVE